MTDVIPKKLNIHVVDIIINVVLLSVRNKAITVARRAEQFVDYNSCARV